MTRKNFFKGLIGALLPLALLGAKKPDIWSTPKGIYVLALRKSLEDRGCYEHCEEYWKSIEVSLEKDYNDVFFMVNQFRFGKEYTYAISAVTPTMIDTRYSDGRLVLGAPKSLGAKVLNYKFAITYGGF